MPLQLDFRDDYLLYDVTETVNFIEERGTPDQSLTIAYALRGQPSMKERAPTAGVYTGSDCQWLLPTPLLAGKHPRPGDRITDQLPRQTTWTILTADFDQLDSIWQCYAVALDLYYLLRDEVTLWEPTNAQDAAGSRVPTFAQNGTTRVARIQLTTEGTEDMRGKRLWVGTYDVFLAVEVSGVTQEWQLRDVDGHVYDIIGTRNRQRIDELAVLQCKREGDST